MDNLNLLIEKRVKQYLAMSGNWYVGRPVMILENDYSLDLHNGDVGICIGSPEHYRVIFESGREFIPELLPAHQPAYAISIHKSQGSEYKNVVVVLNDAINNDTILTRELVYTAVTRAQDSVLIYAETQTLQAAIAQKTLRNSGISHFLQK